MGPNLVEVDDERDCVCIVWIISLAADCFFTSSVAFIPNSGGMWSGMIWMRPFHRVLDENRWKIGERRWAEVYMTVHQNRNCSIEWKKKNKKNRSFRTSLKPGRIVGWQNRWWIKCDLLILKKSAQMRRTRTALKSNRTKKEQPDANKITGVLLY